MAVNWSHAGKTSIQNHQTSPDMEPPREEENRTAKKHVAARHGVGTEVDGVYLVGNCHHGATQDPVESLRRWPILSASRRASINVESDISADFVSYIGEGLF